MGWGGGGGGGGGVIVGLSCGFLNIKIRPTENQCIGVLLEDQIECYMRRAGYIGEPVTK